MQFAMGVHICAHSRHLNMSVVKSLLYFEAFKTWRVLALMQSNKAGYRCLYHMFLFIFFKPWLYP